MTLTEIVLVVDRSGSMTPLAEAHVAGINTFFKEQRDVEGQAKLTLVMFNDRYEVLHDGIPLADAPDWTSATYACFGGTALLDAINRAIGTVRDRHANSIEKPDKVIVAIITDGEENASQELKKEAGLATLKASIEAQQKDGWEFMFFGANIDAFQVGSGLGVAAAAAHNFVPTKAGTENMYRKMSASYTLSRTSTGTDTK